MAEAHPAGPDPIITTCSATIAFLFVAGFDQSYRTILDTANGDNSRTTTRDGARDLIGGEEKAVPGRGLLPASTKPQAN
jgi:hypothetical protein